MRIIHGQGYTESDRLQFKVFINRHILLCMKLLTKAMRKLKICFCSYDNEVRQQMRHLLIKEHNKAQPIFWVWSRMGVA